VKKVVQPRHIEEKNIHGKTPGALFIEQHKDLMKEGEQWMRDTADSCMLVALPCQEVIYKIKGLLFSLTKLHSNSLSYQMQYL
jgi:hypothetical protein